MSSLQRPCVCFGAILLVWIDLGLCQSILDELSNYHQARDRWASSYTFRWSCAVKDEVFSVRLGASGEEQTNDTLRKSSTVSHYQTYVNIGRDGGRTVVKGTLPNLAAPSSVKGNPMPKGEREFIAVYESDWAMYADFSEISDQSHVPPAIVWNCPDSCLNFKNPQEVLIRPAFFALLSGVDPLKGFGGKWTLLSSNDQQIILECREPTGMSHSRLRATFSKQYGNALLRIEQFDGNREPTIPNITWEARHFRHEGTHWIPDQVYTIIRVGINAPISITEYEWKLEKLEKTAATSVIIPIGKEIADYRLVSDLLTNELLWKHKNDFVSYKWLGSLPSKSELRRLAMQQGKLPPSGGGLRMSWVMFLPGLILLGLAVYFYRSMQKRSV